MSYLYSFRFQILVIFLVTAGLVAWFSFQIWGQSNKISAQLAEPVVTYSQQQQLRTESQILHNTAIKFAALFGLLVILGFGYVYLQFVSSMGHVLEGINQVKNGNLKYQIPIGEKGEFGEIASFYNELFTDLAQLHQQLSSTNVTLETKVHQQTEALQQETTRVALALDKINEAVIVTNWNREVIIFNKAAEKLIGYPQQEVIGKQIGQVLQVFDKSTPVPDTTYSPKNVPTDQDVVYQKDGIRMLAAEDKELIVNLVSSQIPNGQAVDIGSIITLEDVSEEKLDERMKLDFVSMAAHDLRTPLTSIKSYLYIYMKENKDKLVDDQKMFLDRISLSAQTLTGLVENILSAAKLERGVLTISTEPADWVAIARQIVGELNERAKDKKIELRFEEPTVPLAQVKIDRLRVSEVLMNLVNNAINYTDSGGSIRVYFEQKDNELITHVADTGQGIPNESISKLFTKFFRVSGKLEKGAKGTGLGLYICKSIVELHHGRIWVESIERQGSTFSFSLPLAS